MRIISNYELLAAFFRKRNMNISGLRRSRLLQNKCANVCRPSGRAHDDVVPFVVSYCTGRDATCRLYSRVAVANSHPQPLVLWLIPSCSTARCCLRRCQGPRMTTVQSSNMRK